MRMPPHAAGEFLIHYLGILRDLISVDLWSSTYIARTYRYFFKGEDRMLTMAGLKSIPQDLYSERRDQV
jgi:hypothetical protein